MQINTHYEVCIPPPPVCYLLARIVPPPQAYGTIHAQTPADQQKRKSK